MHSYEGSITELDIVEEEKDIGRRVARRTKVRKCFHIIFTKKKPKKQPKQKQKNKQTNKQEKNSTKTKTNKLIN
jgi:hypothetical protein